MLRSSQANFALRLGASVLLLLHACAPDSASTDASESPGSNVGGASAGRPASAGSAGALSSSAGRTGTPAATSTLPATGTAGAAGQGTAARGGSTAGASGNVAAVGGSSATAGAGLAGKGAAGMSAVGAAGMTAAAGAGGGNAAANGETGRMVGMTAAHNAVRARQMKPKPEPALPPLTWAADIAKIAQAYAEKLASGGNCLDLRHSMVPGYGENLAGYGGKMATPTDVVEGWSSEEECTTFGPITQTGDECNKTCAMSKSSNGCGHYTQVVWRGTTEVGCGMATCGTGRSAGEVWVCNYRKQGNIIGMKPY